MRVGIIVDGTAETHALPGLFRRISINGVQILNPRHASLHPRATYEVIVRQCKTAIEILRNHEVDKIILLLDHEDNPDCPGVFASTLEGAFSSAGYEVSVVVKNRKFENWLIADPATLIEEMDSRFSVDTAFVGRVSPNRADTVEDAEELLNRVANKKRYHKRNDSIRMCQLINPDVMSCNSRSFRRFLRLLGHQNYQAQSHRPNC